MPQALERIYGSIGFDEPVLYSNFVMSMDGVVTLGSKPSAGSVLSGRNPADRFLMALLRACADAVLIGAGTLRATPGHQWTPEHVYPDLSESFADLRIRLGRKPRPRLVLLSASGEVPISHTAVAGGATIVTTVLGARVLEGRLPESCDVIRLGDGGAVDVAAAIEALRERGCRVILTEGGPSVMGDLVKHDLLDEAFLTLSPVLAGRGEEPRLGMLAGVELLPDHGVWARMLSARRHGDFLFLRYGVKKSS
ncbi:MAG TPA: dihydrofolate reductase family protein [Candidatus Dormibacteraeota bacterium]|nr:dihydrofolate reductase family protein [Candidatus Dormibacteraeota bacterium]